MLHVRRYSKTLKAAFPRTKSISAETKLNTNMSNRSVSTVFQINIGNITTFFAARYWAL